MNATPTGKNIRPFVAKMRLLKLAALLESLPKKRFDFGTFCTIANNKEELAGTDPLKNATACGTSACAMGWAPSLRFAKDAGVAFKVTINKYFAPIYDDFDYLNNADFTINGKGALPTEVGEHLFGVSKDEFNRLFIPGDAEQGYSGLEDYATAKQVAKNIRRFVAKKYG